MSDLFFYGTLRHRPLLQRVLGRALDGVDLIPARLPGHRCAWALDQSGRVQSFPVVEPDRAAAAPGLLARGLGAEDIARLDFYEGGFGYDLLKCPVEPETGAATRARVYIPRPGVWGAGADWSLADWQARWGALALRAAQEVMAYYGRYDAAEVARRFGSIQLRAAAWLAAQARPADRERDLARDVVVERHRHAYLNFFGVEEADLRFRRHDGRLSAPVNRSALMVGQAAVVLPYDPRRDTVLLIEQFRAPVFLAGDPAPWIWEPVAGLVDPGETPEEAAHREAQEEAGLRLKSLEKAGEVYSSTGSSGEYLHLFVGLTDLTHTVRDGGLADEGEDIRSEIISFEALMDGIDRHRYRDMPLVTTALWLARHRDRLRAEG